MPLPRARNAEGTHFVATALPDTALAGLADVKPTNRGGHWGPGRPREVYGQLVRVDTFAGAGAVAIREAFARRGAREVVIVPWDYDPGCAPTYWSRSVRWVEPGLVGFYTVWLRPPSQWANGRPTFDAFTADIVPYPHAALYRVRSRGTDGLQTRPSLDAAEMFSLYEALPSTSDMRGDTGRADSIALEPLRRWAAANPELARRYPADQIVARATHRDHR